MMISAKWAKRVRDLYKEGKTYKEIQITLQAEGYKAPNGRDSTKIANATITALAKHRRRRQKVIKTAPSPRRATDWTLVQAIVNSKIDNNAKAEVIKVILENMK